MRKIFSLLTLISGFILFASCEDDSPSAILKDNVAANSLDAPSSTSYVLTKPNAANTFDVFKWTAPDYELAITSTYSIQLDVAGNKFTNATTLFTTGDLSGSITIGDINKKLLDMGIEPEVESSVEIRVKSVVAKDVEPIYSNTRQFSVTPYATAFPPIYIVGDAQSWNFDKAVKVKRTAPGTYVAIANFVKDGTFRFFETLDWGSKVWNTSFFEGGTVDVNLASADDNDSNFKFVGTGGAYKITVSLLNKTITMEAVDTPTLFMIGDAVQGWDLSKAVELTWMGGGHFEATTSFGAGIFRFYGKADWSAGWGNYPYFSEGVDAIFENANDGDKNFKFVGTAGTYTLIVDTDYLTVKKK